MPSRAIVWFRRDLRLHDHPALARAVAEFDEVVPAFVLDRRLILGRWPSGPRTSFLLGALRELDAGLRERGGALAIREGDPAGALPRLAAEAGAQAVLYASDVSPFGQRRDEAVRSALRAAGVEPLAQPGNFIADVSVPRRRGEPVTVFSPFFRAWLELPRRPVHPAPERVPAPGGLVLGPVPKLADLGLEPELTDPMPPGERAARARMATWLRDGLAHYADRRSRLEGGTSELSPYLHFGCLSARELEARVLAAPEGPGPGAFRRQLAWRDFYAHVLLFHPGNTEHPFQRGMASLSTAADPAAFDAWREGRTGFPLVDAGMRQLRARGWMPNRARLVAASFLTRDLHLSYRLGEAHFMRYLLCGDVAQNNGNWQWAASVGVDPAPHWRRIFNPARQQERFDPDGAYVRRWVPELRDVPADRLAEPWTMPPEQQRAAGCVIGRDYPAPIVDHLAERPPATRPLDAATAHPARAAGRCPPSRT
jgi:deoxyribodipyrimidine photo-lyase